MKQGDYKILSDAVEDIKPYPQNFWCKTFHIFNDTLFIPGQHHAAGVCAPGFDHDPGSVYLMFSP